MAILITMIIDILTAGLFIFRIGSTDQVLILISAVIQFMFSIDLFAVMTLRQKRVPISAPQIDETTRRTTRQYRRKRGGFFIFLSWVIVTGIMVYYVYSALLLFI
ncbi:hypothetical protein NRIC_15010 [Enterococcus florum]|uniref:Uncharacterized protein n=1 Tax=Enterococcus florum TaxID=2480627 RepID=A0A4P5P746_9ENTE|nr:hypothetical protein [Enterococcus florum]GCF93610.1 hypothetical protein NRIC_15010 [Enterococcus florum]